MDKDFVKFLLKLRERLTGGSVLLRSPGSGDGGYPISTDMNSLDEMPWLLAAHQLS